MDDQSGLEIRAETTNSLPSALDSLVIQRSRFVLSREARITRESQRLRLCLGKALSRWLRIGKCLHEIRPKFEHGTWEPYLEGPFQRATGLSSRTASRCLLSYRDSLGADNRDSANPPFLADLDEDLLPPPKPVTSQLNGAAGVSRRAIVSADSSLPRNLLAAARQLFESVDVLISPVKSDRELVSTRSYIGRDCYSYADDCEGIVLINGLRLRDADAFLSSISDRFQSGTIRGGLVVLSTRGAASWHPALRRFSRGVLIHSPETLVFTLAVADRNCEIADVFSEIADVYAPLIERTLGADSSPVRR